MNKKNVLTYAIEKNPYLFFIVKGLSRILKRDLAYINFALYEYTNPKKLSIQTCGKDHQGCIVYVIKEQGMGYGFFAEFRGLLCNLIFAEEIGMIPYVYWGKNHLYYEEGTTAGNNIFKNYFKPVGVDDFRTSQNVVYSSMLQCEYVEKKYGVTGYSSNPEFEEELIKVLKKYIAIKPELEEEFKKETNKLFNGRKVLGVHHRGTDFKNGYTGHPVAVEIEEELERVQKLVERHQMELIFLATDEERVVHQYYERFGAMMRWFPDVHRSDGCKSVAFSEDGRKNHHYLLGKEVLRDVYVLSSCHGLLAGKSQVSYFAKLFNRFRDDIEDFECVEIIDKGVNGGAKYFKLK